MGNEPVTREMLKGAVALMRDVCREPRPAEVMNAYLEAFEEAGLSWEVALVAVQAWLLALAGRSGTPAELVAFAQMRPRGEDAHEVE